MSDVIDIEERRRNFSMRKYIFSGLILLIVIFILFIIISNLFIVREGEYKVVRQFGEVVRVEEEPGLYFKIPFIQTVTSLPKHQLTYDVSESEITTLDKKRVIIDNYAIWKIVDPLDLITNARTIENAEARMDEFIYSVIRTQLGQMNYDEIINDEKTSRGDLNERVKEEVNALLEKDKYGIQVVDVRIKRIDLPPDNEQSVYTRMISERESTAQDYLSRGDAQANIIRAETDREVEIMLAEARADAERIRAEGEEEAARIYNEAFSRDPEFYRLYRTLESYKQVIDDQTVIILPSDSPYARLLQGLYEGNE